MKESKKVFRRMFLLMLCAYCLIPAAFFMMSFADFNVSGFRRGAAYAVGAVFWAGVILGTVFLAVLGSMRKKDKSSGTVKGMPGILSFFRTERGKLADRIMIPELCVAAAASLTRAVVQPVRFVLWSSALFLIVLHSVFNGKNYIYMKG